MAERKAAREERDVEMGDRDVGLPRFALPPGGVGGVAGGGGGVVVVGAEGGRAEDVLRRGGGAAGGVRKVEKKPTWAKARRMERKERVRKLSMEQVRAGV